MSDKNKKIKPLIDLSLERIGTMADVNTVVGTPITTRSGFQIIPFSKVTLANLAGGGEYGDIKVIKEADSVPFAGGSGSVVSMKPLGFLIDDGKTCRMMKVTDQPLDNLIERMGEILQDVVSKK